MITRPEVLAPAGDMECLNSALSFGADAVSVSYTHLTLPTIA